MISMKKVIDFISRHNMLHSDITVLAAVSGGADSVCMLHILQKLSKDLGFSVCAAHFNHLLRGDESDRDESFVKKLCCELDIPLHCGRGDVSEYAKTQRLGLEEAARKMRYTFLYSTAKSVNAAKIATAHNADDNAETVILNLTRGTGLAGLRGIPPVNGIIIRPLLCMTRNEIEAYLSQRNLEFVTDSTNLEDICSRNKLRHYVMPVLRELNPRFSESFMRACDLARQDEDYLSSEADRIIADKAVNNRINASFLHSLPPSLSSRIIRKMSGTELSASLISSVLSLCQNNTPSAKLNIPGMIIHREYEDIVFGTQERIDFLPIDLVPDQSAVIPELNLEVTLEKAIYEDNIYKSFTVYLFKTSDVYGKITIRPRQTGDMIKLRGTDCTKSAKKLFIEKRIPAAIRHLIPVISDERGVLGIYKIGCDERGTPAVGDTIYKIQFKEMSHR